MSLQQYMNQPREVSIETLALCNAECEFCPYPTLARKGAKLPDYMLLNLSEQMEQFREPFYLSPFKVNEPLLDKRLIPWLKYVNHNVPLARLRLFTNGSPLTMQKILDIAELQNVEHLWVSLNSHDPIAYQKIMGLPALHTHEALHRLHHAVMAGRFPHPVVVSAVITPDFDAAGFVAFVANEWPYFKPQLIKQDGWLGYVPPSDPAIPDTPCVRWFELSITAEGKASLCCMDGKAEFSIGSVHDSSLLEIYNGPTFRGMREGALSRKAYHPCSTCTY